MTVARSHQHLLEQAEERISEVLESKWTLARLLGAGGVAAVYEAEHRNGKRVAIKILHAHFAHDFGVRERFFREAYVANSIGHPAVVQIDDDGVDDDGHPFLVMERVDGVTLEQRRLEAGGTLTAEELLPIVAQLLDVLVVAHERGVVHRDLKPENLMLTGTGAVRVLDFGLARAIELEPDNKLTQPGAILGTPSFMAPEQALGRWELVDERTDLWALGAICFTALTGRAVHIGATAQETMALAGTAHAPALADVLEDVAPELAAFVDRALVYAKPDRYADADDMATELRDVVAPALGLTLPLSETPPWLTSAPKRATVSAETSYVRAVEQADTVVSSDAPARSRRPRSAQWLPIVLAGLLGAAIVWGIMGWRAREAPPSEPTKAAPAPLPNPYVAASAGTAPASAPGSSAEPSASPSAESSASPPATMSAPASTRRRPPSATTARAAAEAAPPRPATAASEAAPPKPAPTNPLDIRK